MKAEKTSHYLKNQFLGATRRSRKRCQVLADDHHAKLTARSAVEGGAVAALLPGWTAVYAAWSTAYKNWRNALAAWRGATQKVENLLAELLITPPAGGRSKLDEWEGRLAGLFGENDPIYQYFLPEGRRPFRKLGKDAILSEVQNFSVRLAAKGPELAAAVVALQAEAAALAASGLPVPEALADALGLAQDRQATVAQLAVRVMAFFDQLNAARVEQQGREGDVDAAALEAETQRLRICRQMYSNMAMLMGIYTQTDSSAAQPQLRVAEYFQFETLRFSRPDEDEA